MIPGIVSLQGSDGLASVANCDENVAPCDNSGSCDDIPCNTQCDCYDSGEGEEDE